MDFPIYDDESESAAPVPVTLSIKELPIGE